MDLRLWHPVFPTEPCTLQTCSSTNRKTTNSSEITKTMAENCRASLLRVNSYLRKGFSGPLRKMLILIFAFGIWFVLIPVSNWPQSPFFKCFYSILKSQPSSCQEDSDAFKWRAEPLFWLQQAWGPAKHPQCDEESTPIWKTAKEAVPSER